MKKLLVVSMLLSISAFASNPSQRCEELQSKIAAGKYEAVYSEGVREIGICRIVNNDGYMAVVRYADHLVSEIVTSKAAVTKALVGLVCDQTCDRN